MCVIAVFYNLNWNRISFHFQHNLSYFQNLMFDHYIIKLIVLYNYFCTFCDMAWLIRPTSNWIHVLSFFIKHVSDLFLEYILNLFTVECGVFHEKWQGVSYLIVFNWTWSYYYLVDSLKGYLPSHLPKVFRKYCQWENIPWYLYVKLGCSLLI